MPDIREVHVSITRREDGRAYARSAEVPGLLLSAKDAGEMMPNIPKAIATTFEHRGFAHVGVKLISRADLGAAEEKLLYEVDLG